MKQYLYISLLIICLAPVCAIAAPAVSEPFWIDQADTYVHYTLDRIDYSETGRHADLDPASYGTFSMVLTPGITYPTAAGPQWSYQLGINNDQNPDYMHPAGDNELIYMWVEFTYFKPEDDHGGTSASFLSGNDVNNNLNLNEQKVDSDLNWTSGPLYDSTAGTTWSEGLRTLGYMFKIEPSQQPGNSGWSWENTIDWHTDDDIYMTEVYAATISFQNYSEVPVPGSIFLLLSGMIGLAGITSKAS